MTPASDQPVIDYLQELRELEPDPAALAALGAVRRPRRVRRTLALSLAIVAGSSALAAATGVWPRNPDPIPPARVVPGAVPADVTAAVSVFERPPRPRDRSPEARAALTGLRSPFVVDAGSVRAVGTTPRAYVAFARTDVAALPPRLRAHEPPGGTQGVYVAVSPAVGDGPFPLVDIERGAAWGIKEHSAGGRLFTGVVPDGVARVQLRLRGGAWTTHPVHGNVVLAKVDEGALDGWRWLDADGRTLRRF